MLRLIWKVFLGPLPEHLTQIKEGTKTMVIPLTALAVIIVILGIWPSFILRVIVPASEYVATFFN